MNLLIDIDGVIAAYDFPALTREFYGKAVTNKQILAYSIADVLGVTRESVNRMFTAACHYPPNFVKGAMKSLLHFQAQGDAIYIYTNRLYFMTRTELIHWLYKYGIPFIGLFGDTKATEFDFHIDDSPCKLMETDGRVKHKLLFSAPWNKSCLDIEGKLQRVKNWKEVREVLDSGRVQRS